MPAFGSKRKKNDGEVQNVSNRSVFGVRKSRYDTGRRKMTGKV